MSPSPQPASSEQRLIIISGKEGAGKSTIVRALLPSTPYGARIDAEDIGQTNPGASQPMVARPGAQHLPGPAGKVEHACSG